MLQVELREISNGKDLVEDVEKCARRNSRRNFEEYEVRVEDVLAEVQAEKYNEYAVVDSLVENELAQTFAERPIECSCKRCTRKRSRRRSD